MNDRHRLRVLTAHEQFRGYIEALGAVVIAGRSSIGATARRTGVVAPVAAWLALDLIGDAT